MKPVVNPKIDVGGKLSNRPENSSRHPSLELSQNDLKMSNLRKKVGGLSSIHLSTINESALLPRAAVPEHHAGQRYQINQFFSKR